MFVGNRFTAVKAAKIPSESSHITTLQVQGEMRTGCSTFLLILWHTDLRPAVHAVSTPPPVYSVLAFSSFASPLIRSPAALVCPFARSISALTLFPWASSLRAFASPLAF